VRFVASSFTVVDATVAQAHYHATHQDITIAGAQIAKIDTGLTLDEAFEDLTNGLTKADLVALGDDFGLTLSDSSLKSELLDAIRAYLEGLAS
jgi:hypothetical protein